MDAKTKSRAGFIALVGAPNAGKSTLVNQLVGSRVSIVTRKAQTTRTRIRGIASHGDCQLILTDTPGLFAPKDEFDEAMVNIAMKTAQSSDLIWFIIDATVHNLEKKLQTVLDNFFTHEGLAQKPIFILLNKIDNLAKPELLPLAQKIEMMVAEKSNYVKTGKGQIFMISALDGEGIDALLDLSCACLPESPFLYPEDQIADMPLQLMAAEITRGHIFDQTHQEIPYEIAVETLSWKAHKKDSVRIEQNIYVSRLALKKILVGHKGQKIKQISIAARLELEELLGKKVHLFLFVKHHENWRKLKQFHAMQGMDLG